MRLRSGRLQVVKKTLSSLRPAAHARVWRAGRGLRTANDRDVCVERPLHHEVVATGDAQRGADRAVAPFDFARDLRGVANHLGLDVRVLVGKIDQDHVAELKPLSVDLNRHPVRV